MHTYVHKYTYTYVHFGQMHTHRYAHMHTNAHAHSLICLWNYNDYKKHVHHPSGIFYNPITISITSMDTRGSKNIYVRPLCRLLVKKIFEIV